VSQARAVASGMAALCLVAGAGFAWAVAGVAWRFPGQLDSDAAVPALLAREMLARRAWVPSSWYYVNDDIWLLAPQLFCLPAVAVLGPTGRAVLLGNLLGLALAGGCLFLLTRRLCQDGAVALVAALAVLAPFSAMQVQMVYLQLAYGWITGLLALLAYLALGILPDEASPEASGAGLPPALWAYGALGAFLAAGNLARALFYWWLPFSLTCLLGAPGLWRSPRARVLLAVTAGAMAVGAAVHFVLRSSLHLKPWVSAFRTAGGWGQKMGFLWEGLPRLVGTPALAAGPAAPWEAALAAVRVLFFAGALVAMVLAWRGRGVAAPERLAGRLVSLMLASVLLAFVVSRVAVAAASIRYLLPPVLLGLLVLVALAVRRWSDRRPAVLALTAALAAAFVGGGALAARGNAAPTSCGGPERLCPLLAAAGEAGLRAGLSTYWNANAATLASGGQVRVCPVSLDPPLSPQRWLTSSDCFRSAGYRDGFFVALATGEREASAGVVRATLGEPERTVVAGELELWIYPPAEGRDWRWLER